MGGSVRVRMEKETEETVIFSALVYSTVHSLPCCCGVGEIVGEISDVVFFSEASEVCSFSPSPSSCCSF